MHFTETAWWHDVCDGIFGTRKGGARIIVDAEGASTGVGKTSLAVFLARVLAKQFDYDLSKDDLTLSGAEYLDRWREHPDEHQPSVLVLDELAGAGAGDNRRAMSHQNVNLARSWQLMRKKRVVTICTLAHWSDADKKLRRLADYRLLCLSKPIGYFRPYQVGASFAKGKIRTHGYDDIDRIQFPDMKDHDDPYYAHLDEQKTDLLDSTVFDADALRENGDDDDTRDTLDDLDKERITELDENTDLQQSDIAEAFGIDRSTVSKVANGKL